MDKSYTLPKYSIPGLRLENHLEDLCEFIIFVESRGHKIRGTRLERYRKYLEDIVDGGQDSKNIFHDIQNEEFNTKYDVLLYVLREVHELMWIQKGFKSKTPKNIDEKLSLLIGGKDFAALDKKTVSRNTQFELRIASYFSQTGYTSDLSSKTDIIATKGKHQFYVECKRVSSQGQLFKRLLEAKDQLNNRIPGSNLSLAKYGIIVVDVTKIAFKHNGVIMGYTSEHARDLIQDKLKEISNGIASHESLWNLKPLIMVWLQVHIPSLILYPSTFSTRISSLFISSHKVSSKRKFRKAFEELKLTLEIGEQKDPREITKKLPPIRNEITIPKGTIFKWDEEILREFLDLWELSGRDPDRVILEVEFPTEHAVFHYQELIWLLPNIPHSLREKLSGELSLARSVLMAMLIRQRNPYESG
ncbi:hypothetical protein LP43_1441 [Methylophaga thiooxydans]|uniref:Uncharacterized protein n=1 Tax=Methylophaga thiooxydans TaxID=392484 RepID=A0A0A0BG73_9GAMM|nr:hypothetical protein [Methylophaga thiooxydans]KGM06946.1 hypothetical protein LP43_1441 [Methylophaga thiooxydans]